MKKKDARIAIGVFHDEAQAYRALEALRGAGFDPGVVSVLFPGRGTQEAEAAKTSDAAAGGAVTGGILGGVAGWLAGVGIVAIPGVGPIIAGGIVAAALGGAAIGAGLGAIGGALIGMGVPEEEARYYESEVHADRALITVHAGDRYEEAAELLRLYGGYDVRSRTEPMPDERAAPPDEAPVRFAAEMAHRPEYRGRAFTDAEAELRHEWERRHADVPWPDIAPLIEERWESGRATLARD